MQRVRFEPGTSNTKDFIDISQAFDKVWHTGLLYKLEVLRATVNAPWYVTNRVLHADLKVPTVREEITKFNVKYRDKITAHPNELASTLLEEEEPRRLKRFKATDLHNHIFVNIFSQNNRCGISQ